MINKKTILISAAVVAIITLQVLILCSRPKVEFNAEPAVKQQLTHRNDLLNDVKKDVPVFSLNKETLDVALNLELIGTAAANPKDAIAFIKSLDTNKQGIYKTGYMIGEARVMKIVKGEVDLNINGKTITLAVKDKRSAAPQATGAIVSRTDDEIVMSRNAILNEASSILKTVRKMSVKPYKQSNVVVGMKVAGVSEGSIIEQAGIHNDDVVTSINNQKIDSYQKALQVFKKVRNQQEIKVSVLRGGEAKQLCYKIGN